MEKNMATTKLTRDQLTEKTGRTYPENLERLDIETGRNRQILTAHFTNGTTRRVWPTAANGVSCDTALRDLSIGAAASPRVHR
jgi:hypothetical protein